MNFTSARVAASALRRRPWLLGLGLLLAPSSAQALEGDGLAGRSVVELDLGANSLTTRLEALGPHRLEISTQLSIGRGADHYEQADSYVLVLDPRGNYQVLLSNADAQLDTTRIGEELFVRYDRGHLRRKSRRDMDADAPPQRVLLALAQCLQPFLGASLGDGRSETVQGRSASRYPLHLGRAENIQAPAAVLRGTPPTAAWRSQARPLGLQGHVVLDGVSALPLAAEVDGRLEVPAKPAPPTQLRLQCSLKIVDLGRVQALKVPTRVVAEYRRLPRDRDPLGFFRDQLPAAAAKP